MSRYLLPYDLNFVKASMCKYVHDNGMKWKRFPHFYIAGHR